MVDFILTMPGYKREISEKVKNRIRAQYPGKVIEVRCMWRDMDSSSRMYGSIITETICIIEEVPCYGFMDYIALHSL